MGRIKVEEAFIERIIEGFQTTLQESIKAALEAQTKIMVAQNQALVEELKRALYPKNDNPIQMGRMNPEILELQWQRDQGLITEEYYQSLAHEFEVETELT